MVASTAVQMAVKTDDWTAGRSAAAMADSTVASSVEPMVAWRDACECKE